MASPAFRAARDVAADLVDHLQDEVVALAAASGRRGLSTPEFLAIRRQLSDRKAELAAAFASFHALQTQGV